MSGPTPSPLDGLLEEATRHHAASTESALTSIAISLKRIADVAEATAMGLWNYDPSLTPDGRPKGDAS